MKLAGSLMFELEPAFVVFRLVVVVVVFSFSVGLLLSTVLIGIVCRCRRSFRADDFRCNSDLLPLVVVVAKLSDTFMDDDVPARLDDWSSMLAFWLSTRLSAVLLRFMSSLLLLIWSREWRWWWWWWWWCRFLRRPPPLPLALPESSDMLDTLAGNTFAPCCCCCCWTTDCWQLFNSAAVGNWSICDCEDVLASLLTSMRQMLFGFRGVGAPFNNINKNYQKNK